MKLLTPSISRQLLRNGRIAAALAEDGRAEADFVPVVKLFTPDAACTCLLNARCRLHLAAERARPR
jgi:hypothetical protein